MIWGVQHLPPKAFIDPLRHSPNELVYLRITGRRRNWGGTGAESLRRKCNVASELNALKKYRRYHAVPQYYEAAQPIRIAKAFTVFRLCAIYRIVDAFTFVANRLESFRTSPASQTPAPSPRNEHAFATSKTSSPTIPRPTYTIQLPATSRYNTRRAFWKRQIAAEVAPT